MAKRVTISDVAELAGVSTATVSYYMNGRYDKMSEATRAKISRAISKSGYVPSAQARALQGKSSGVIAVLICNIMNTWDAQLLRGIESTARGEGYQTIVCDTGFDYEAERSYVHKMLSLGVDGFVVQPTSHVRPMRDLLAKADKPVVFVDYGTFDLNGHWVKADLYDGFYTAVSECAERGYEDFVLLADDPHGARTRLERIQGVQDAVQAHDATFRMHTVTREAPSVEELTHYFAYQLNPARRTLLVVPHQWALARVFSALEPLRDAMPDRIGLLGIDNPEWTPLVSPSITTVQEPVFEEGQTAVEMLLELLHGSTLAEPRRNLKCTVSWRSSTLPEPQ